jgi:peroxisomal enoyl-CoA hydratase 2
VTDDDQDLHGGYEFPVEAGKIREFATATLSRNPVHQTRAAARAAGLPAMPAPPTFVMAAEHYAPGQVIGADGLPGGVRSLYGEMDFEYLQPVYAGDVLTVRAGTVSVSERSGRRGGAMTLTTTATVFEKDGRPAVVRRGTRIVTSVDVSRIAATAAVSALPGAGAEVLHPQVALSNLADQPLTDAAALSVNQCVTRSVQINRTHIVRYAGASGDFAPIHHDDALARAFGNPAVFAHGMVSGGIIGSMVSDWFGPGNLRRLVTRFVGVVFPGDVIDYRVTIAALHKEPGMQCIDLSLHAGNQRNESVLTGSARVALPL